MFEHIKPKKGKTKKGSLLPKEKEIIKALLNKGYRNQDIQFIANHGREATINSARITEAKNYSKIATNDEVNFYLKKQSSYDANTGLNPYVDTHKRLIKAREAMLSAVQIFNNPTIQFKTEQFCVLSQIAWTAIIQEWVIQKISSHKIYKQCGRETLSLNALLKISELPLDKSVISNLETIKKLRDSIEHDISSFADDGFAQLFQANILNFEDFITSINKKLSLGKELSFALQFCKMDKNCLSELEMHNLPPKIKAIYDDMTSSEFYGKDTTYTFAIYYGLVANSKSQSDLAGRIPVASDKEEEIKDIIRENEKPKFLPAAIVAYINKQGFLEFGMRNHTKLWQENKKLFRTQENKFGVDISGTWYWYEKWKQHVLQKMKAEINQ